MNIVVNRTIGLNVLLCIRQRIKMYRWELTNKGLNGTVVNRQVKRGGGYYCASDKGLKCTVENRQIKD